MSDVEVAELLAVAAHDGQVDKAGRPYFEHVQAVAAALERYGDDAVMAGFLHDIVEDTDITLDYLRAAGFPGDVVNAVDSVTRRPGEPYEDMIRRAASHPLGRLVKLADNAHNSDLERLAALDPATAVRLQRRYRRARAILLAPTNTEEP